MADPTHEIELSDSDEHFSDAQSGIGDSDNHSPVRPLAQINTVDPESTHSEIPGTNGYIARRSDAEPGERAPIGDTEDLKKGTAGGNLSSEPIPNVAASPRLSKTPGAVLPYQRTEDAVRDNIFGSKDPTSTGDSPIEVQVQAIKTMKSGEREAPDLIEEARDAPGSPHSRSAKAAVTRSGRASSEASRKGMKGTSNEVDEEDGGFGDDFDDFEEGEEDAGFDDFNDGFQEAGPPVQAQPAPAFAYPVLNFSTVTSPAAIFAATEPYLDTLFPTSSLPQPTPSSTPSTPSSSAPTFLTSRSASLWTQLVAPPPLQPPNWIRSRIRRLFLISLGVPIDLDEILPASKQKKLVLPSTPISPRTSTSLSRLKSSSANASNTSVDSQGNNRSARNSRRKAPPHAPGLDLLSARQLCNVTDAARAGFTDAELRNHVKRLEELQGAAKDALEFWTKKTDETIGDREAFEGVIENLVKHARKVRK